MKPTWKNLLLAARKVIGLGALSLIIVFAILELYTQPWTGLGDYTTPAGNFVRGKTLWDWMELLIIPLFLAAGAVAVNRSERELERQRIEERAKLEREIATDRQQEAALQAYLDRIAELLLKEKLRTTKKAEVRDVARTRTASVMRGLDAKRNNIVIQFLREAKLILEENSILKGINLESVNLQETDLYDVNLEEAYLERTNLRHAQLARANLQRANLLNALLQRAVLYKAHLEDAFLRDANLEQAILLEANLEGADLTGANLQDADLTCARLLNAKVTSEQLATAKSLKGATMPDGTKHG
jgi:uncharacterized protein YjbI with pentapeptide repeats